MSYAAAIDQLNSLAPELHSPAGQPRRKFSLDQVRTLLHRLGNPQAGFRSVLIAGTNGKGSTAATLASILAASGVRTGLYTSPHLERPNERIRIDGAEISDESFAGLYFRVHDAACELVSEGELPQHPSYFELLTALGFLAFAEQKVELAVLEVGMGGRLDATNVVDPLLSIVTDISLDHMEWLGSTIAAIAREKAGILRPAGTLITLPQHPDANQVLGEVAMELGSRAINAAAYMPGAHGAVAAPYTVEALGATVPVDSPLAGAHQHRNLALAIAAAVELATSHGLPITPASLAAGIRQTRWPGRLERISRNGAEWILDVAHNPAGAWALRSALRTSLLSAIPPGLPSGLPSGPSSAAEPPPLPALVFSCLRDKPAAELAQILFPLFEQVILVELHTARAASLHDLEIAASRTGTRISIAASVRDALDLGRNLAAGLDRARAPRGPLVVSGSVYLVGEARSLLLSGQEWEHESSPASDQEPRP